MLCSKCGSELDSNNVCTNPNCITKVNSVYDQDQSTQSNAFDSSSNNSKNDFNNSYNQGFNNFGTSNQNDEFRDANGISAMEMMEFIGNKNPEYYMDKWTRFQENPKFISWNWPAFLFTIYWFWFRKMYSIAGIIFAISFSSGLLLSHYRWLSYLVSLTIMIGSGLLANQLYMNNATQKIKSAKVTTSMGFDTNMLFRRLRSMGGITWVPLFVAIALFVITTLIVIVVFMTAGIRLGSFRY